MSGLCGWFSSNPTAEAPAHLDRMLAASRAGGAGRHTSATRRAALGTFGRESVSHLVEIEGFVLTVVGHPRLVVERWPNFGSCRDRAKRFAKTLRRPFTHLAVTSHSQGGMRSQARGMFAIDRIGVHQLVYARVSGALAFATTLDALAGHPGVQRRISPQADLRLSLLSCLPRSADDLPGIASPSRRALHRIRPRSRLRSPGPTGRCSFARTMWSSFAVAEAGLRWSHAKAL